MNLKTGIIAAAHSPRLPEDHYRLLIESISDHAIISLDPNGYIITWSAGAHEMKQYTAEEVIGKHFSLFYTPEAKAKDYPAMELREAKRVGKFEDEGWRVRKNGSVFWANVIITPIYNQERELLGYSKITRDLTERKKAEDDLFKAYEEVKESEEKFRHLIEGVTDYAIFMLSPTGLVATWNEGAKKLKGYEAHEIIGKYYSKFYSREAIEQGIPEQALKKARAEGRYEVEGWRYRKDGSAFWANTILTAIYNNAKEIIGFSKITRDLTDKKKLEQQLYQMNEELKESEEKNRLLINSIQDYAILMLDTEGIVISWNLGAELIKGYSADEIIGKHFSVFYSREAIESGFPQYELKKAVEDGHFEDEGWRLRKDGTAFWANVVITPVYNLHNRLLGFAKITRDLTERRQYEQMLVQKNKELARTNNELDNFVYTASHELKSPITNLEGLLTALDEEIGTQNETQGKLLTMMRGAVTSLKNVINNLADVNRLQQEKETPERVYIPELLEEVKKDLRDLISTSKTRITEDISGFEYLEYSRENLRSILYNLLLNAIHHASSRTKPEITISTSLTDTREHVVSVADNGPGMADNKVGEIFSMFKRPHEHNHGPNISLYVVKRILEYSGDRIVIKSEEGKGTEFNVYFSQEGY